MKIGVSRSQAAMIAEIIIVTRGAGFMGSHLCQHLLERGHKEVCLDNFCTGTPANLSHLLDNPAFMLLERDIVEALA